jgi:hypothetical protein
MVTAESGRLLMLWFYSRNHQTLQVEVRFDEKAGDFSLGVRGPDGNRYERMRDAAACRVRLDELEAQLNTDRWVRGHGGL